PITALVRVEAAEARHVQSDDQVELTRRLLGGLDQLHEFRTVLARHAGAELLDDADDLVTTLLGPAAAGRDLLRDRALPVAALVPPPGVDRHALPLGVTVLLRSDHDLVSWAFAALSPRTMSSRAASAREISIANRSRLRMTAA